MKRKIVEWIVISKIENTPPKCVLQSIVRTYFGGGGEMVVDATPPPPLDVIKRNLAKIDTAVDANPPPFPTQVNMEKKKIKEIYTREILSRIAHFINPLSEQKQLFRSAAVLNTYRQIMIYETAIEMFGIPSDYLNVNIQQIGGRRNENFQDCVNLYDIQTKLAASKALVWCCLWHAANQPETDCITLWTIAFMTSSDATVDLDFNASREDIAHRAIAGLIACRRGLKVGAVLSQQQQLSDEDDDVVLDVSLADMAGPLAASRSLVAETVCPRSAKEAIALAAILFGIDISKSDCPISDFLKMATDVEMIGGINSICDRNITIDKWFRPMPKSSLWKWYKLCPQFYDIVETWQPFFASLYTTHQLVFFARRNGFSVEMPQSGSNVSIVTSDEAPAAGISKTNQCKVYPSLSSALANAYSGKIQNVFIGTHPNVTNSHSPISLESISDTIRNHGYYSVLSFMYNNNATANEENSSENTIVSITVFDLAELISRTKSLVFCTPDDGKTRYMTKRVGYTLSAICESCETTPRYYASLSDEAREAFHLLKVGIASAQKRREAFSHHAVELLEAIAESENPADAISQAVNAYTKLLHMGMYMRGWKLKKDDDENRFPLTSIETNYEAERQNDVDLNVSLATIEYTQSINSITDPTIRRLVRSSPLLRLIPCKEINRRRQYEGGVTVRNRSFAPVLDEEQGLTVEDRVAIVIEGENSESIYSCMRMSSNFFVASAFYYLVIPLCQEHLESEIDINRLEEIM
jgi:hypothetical protein